jgi:molybdate transport system substrate-binding protein
MRASGHARVGLVVLVAAANAGCRRERPAPVVRVAAAADLAVAFEEAGELFRARTGTPVTFTFGSSGLLAKQLREGAPFDVFAAANLAFAHSAIEAGVCDAQTLAPYAVGRLVLWTREGPAPTLAELADERFARIAIAHPEHAPYGQAAKAALVSTGIWERVAPRLVHGENVQQALQFAQTGNADAALVAASLVVNRTDGVFRWIDEALHPPLLQALVVCRGGAHPGGGRAFAAFVGSPEGRALMERHGFALPAGAGRLPP